MRSVSVLVTLVALGAILSGCITDPVPEERGEQDDHKPRMPRLADFAGCDYYVKNGIADLCDGNVQVLASPYSAAFFGMCAARAGPADLRWDAPSDTIHLRFEPHDVPADNHFFAGTLQWNDGPVYSFATDHAGSIYLRIPGADLQDLWSGAEFKISLYGLDLGGHGFETELNNLHHYVYWIHNETATAPMKAVFRIDSDLRGEFTFPPADAPTAHSLEGDDFSFRVTGSTLLHFDGEVQLLEDRC